MYIFGEICLVLYQVSYIKKTFAGDVCCKRFHVKVELL